MPDQKEEAPRRRKGRSPSYPAIDLGVAIERAQAIYDNEGRHAAPLATLAPHWGYSAKSSSALVTIAALKKYDLIEDEGKGSARVAQLSKLALRILLAPGDDAGDRAKAIREAALAPGIHAELWGKYEGSLPSDATLKYHLLMDRDFTEAGADDFIAQFRRTIEFAQLSGSDTLTRDEEDNPLVEENEESGMSAAAEPIVPATAANAPSDTKDFRFTVTLYGGRLATVTTPVPMSKRNLERLQRMIADQLEPFIDDPEAE